MTSRPFASIAWVAPAAVIALAILPYAQTLSFGFTLDDANTIVGHRGVKEALSWHDIVRRDSWGRSQFDTVGVWRPLVTLTFWLDQHVGGGRAWVFHFTNVVLYAALIALADRFLARWCEGALSAGARWLALAAFGALAIHADVVPSSTGRAETLAALFSLGAIAIATCTRELGAREIALSTAALLLALVSKESSAPMVVLVPFLAWRAHANRSPSSRSGVMALAACGVLVALAVSIFRATSMPFLPAGPERAFDNPFLAADTTHRLVGALALVAFRLKHVFAGGPLVPDYSFAVTPGVPADGASVALGALFVIACAACVVLGWKPAPRLADATIAFGLSYAPMSNILVLTPGIADRHLFFPSLWLATMIALALDRALHTRPARWGAAAGALGFILAQTWSARAYASTWRDDVTLLSAAARVYPNVYRTQRNLAHALADDARDDDAAYHLVAAEMIYARYPTPVARDTISPTWDDEPLAARLEHLREAFGAEATCAASKIASARVRSWGDARAGDAIDAWTKGACAP